VDTSGVGAMACADRETGVVELAVRHALPRLVPCPPAATSTRLALGQDGHVRLWRQTRFALPFPPRHVPVPVARAHAPVLSRAEP
jgi:hypothetical protein